MMKVKKGKNAFLQKANEVNMAVKPGRRKRGRRVGEGSSAQSAE